MKAHVFRLGEPCFIANAVVHPSFVKFRVMSAVVTNIAHGGRAARGTSVDSRALAGHLLTEGEAFLTEGEARASLADFLEKIKVAGEHIPLEGQPVKANVPAEFPAVGDTVYLLDPKAGEVLEVEVALATLEYGRTRIGYDPGHSESDLIEIKEWWREQADALATARERYGRDFAPVSKEQVATRDIARMRAINDEIAERLRSPAYLARFKKLGAALPAITA